ncbi:hypothetical protein CB1_001578005 [Camelus ferus]|nr:hypothetical protein CB1_001578005 [Camelus ferus]
MFFPAAVGVKKNVAWTWGPALIWKRDGQPLVGDTGEAHGFRCVVTGLFHCQRLGVWTRPSVFLQKKRRQSPINILKNGTFAEDFGRKAD